MAATLLELRNTTLTWLNDLQDPITGTADRYSTFAVNLSINSAIKHYVKILNSNYQGYLSVDLPLNLIANVREYALPASFRSPIYQVRRTIDQSNYFLDPFQPYNAVLDEVAVSNESWLPNFWLEGNRILFTQKPSNSETAAVIIKHQLKVINLTTDGQQLPDELYDMEDCVSIRAANRLLGAKDVSGGIKNVGFWSKELQEAEAAFYMQVGNRYVKPDHPLPIADDDNFYY
jgi:hypothetical protein